MNSPYSIRRRRAFTLVEVLATLTLAAIVLPVAMKGISMATAAAAETRRRVEATALAGNQLAELVATGGWQAPGLSGDFSPEWPDYQWTAEVTDWQGTTLKQLQVRVTWTSRGSEHSLALTTLVYVGGS